MKCIFVSGRYSANNPIDMFDNMREGIRVSSKLLQLGFAPFCPWVDFHFHLVLKDREILTIQDYYHYSIAWLKKSDAILMLKGWRESKGALMEHLKDVI